MKVTQGNVFDHLGFAPEESLELKIKADILLAIREHIKKRGLTQKQIAEKLKVHQPDASKLMSGKNIKRDDRPIACLWWTAESRSDDHDHGPG
jgi:predicted XRE-type DNA-binding protein